ncbi:caspase family protein [Azospirillum endophyticum]
MLIRLLFVCLLLLPATGHGETRVALVIGNAAYANAGTLANPVNDARSMASALSALGFNVTELENVGMRAMTRAISQFGAKLSNDGVALFYYAGHGMQVRGRNFLIPVDAEITSESSAVSESVDIDAVLQQLAGSTRLNLVILDACRNNPFERTFRGASSGGLAPIDAPTGTMIAFATAPGKTARDGTGRNGLYTSKLLEAMAVPGIKVEDVFKRVRIAVAQVSKNDQVPWEASSLIGDFYFIAPQTASTGGVGSDPMGSSPGSAVTQISLEPLVPATEINSRKRLQYKLLSAGKAKYLLMTGPIAPGDYRTAMSALNEVGPVNAVLLDSDGGALDEAMEIGRLLRSRKLMARVPSGATCASACNFILMGGVIRQVDPDAEFIVHVFTTTGDEALLGTVQKLIREEGVAGAKAVVLNTEQRSAISAAKVARYLVEMSVSLRFLTLFADTPNPEPVRLRNDKLRELNVINSD